LGSKKLLLVANLQKAKGERKKIEHNKNRKKESIFKAHQGI